VSIARSSVSAIADLRDVLQKLDRDGVNQLPVMENGHAVGTVTREDIIGRLQKQAVPASVRPDEVAST